MANFKQHIQRYWTIRWLRRSVIGVSCLTMTLLAIPLIIQYSITHLLVKQGADKATIEDINVNLFAGTFELNKLLISTGQNQPSKLEHFYANINMLDLLSSQIVIDKLQVDGLIVDIQHMDGSNLTINGLPISANPSNSPEKDNSPENESEAIAFGVHQFSLINSEINYHETDFSQINQLHLVRLKNLKSWNPSSIASLEVDSTLNHAAFKVNAELSLFDTVRQFKGNSSLSSLAFSHYEKFYMSHLEHLQGSINFNSTFDISLSDSISATLDNTIQIETLEANYQGIKPALEKFTLQGKTEISNINISELQNTLRRDNNSQDQQLNLLTGSIKLDQLAVTSGTNKASRIKSISMDIHKLDALANRFVLNELLIEGIDSNIHRADDGQISVNGLKIPVSENTSDEQKADVDNNSDPVTFAIHKLSLLESDINYRETNFNQINHINSINMTNLKSWDKSSLVTIELQSILNDASFTLNAEITPFDDIKHIKGHSTLSSLKFAPYQKFYREHLDHLQGSISLESEFDVNLADTLSASVSSKIQVDDLKLNYQNISQSVETISWNGSTQYSDNTELSLKGDLQIKNNQTIDNKQNYLISSFDRLLLNGLEKNLKSIHFNQLNISKLKLVNLQQDDLLVGLNDISIQGLDLQPDTPTLRIHKIELDNPELKIEINDQKQLVHLTPLLNSIDYLSSATEQNIETQSDQKSSTPMDIQISKLELMNPGTIVFSDSSVSPNYKTRINLNRIDINNLSSSDKANFDILLKQGKYAGIEIKGNGLIFDPGELMNVNAEIKQLDLPPITPYTSNLMGYGMKSGVIDSSIKVELKKRVIDSEVALQIDSIEVVETSKETAEQVSSASGMSIDLALSSLKNSDNIIDLKLPIKGNIDQPDFDLSHIINKAMGKAMKSATLSYLKHSLQPFGSLVTLYSLAKKAANHITLPAVLFNPNSLDFKEDQQKLLDKVIKVLSNRPGLKIKACGISALEDQTAIKTLLLEAEISRLKALQKATDKKITGENIGKTDIKEVETIDIDKITIDPELVQQKMKDLADARSARVKAIFLEQGKLEPKRILNCLSASNIEEKTVASGELLV